MIRAYIISLEVHSDREERDELTVERRSVVFESRLPIHLTLHVVLLLAVADAGRRDLDAEVGALAENRGYATAAERSARRDVARTANLFGHAAANCRHGSRSCCAEFRFRPFRLAMLLRPFFLFGLLLLLRIGLADDVKRLVGFVVDVVGIVRNSVKFQFPPAQ